MKLKVLSAWLKDNGYKVAANKVEELEQWDEPWHEEAVKEFGDTIPDEKPDFDFNFKKHKEDSLEYAFEVYEAIMKKEGFKLAYEHKKQVLGEGAYGVVFEGIYNGKPAAAKIVIDSNLKGDEVDNWYKILDAKKTMPKELQKHIPDIYHIGSGTIDINYGEDKFDYEIIIMEKLYKLPARIIKMISGLDNKKNTHKYLANENYIDFASKKIAEYLNEFMYYKSIKLGLTKKIKLNPSSIFKIIYDEQNNNWLKNNSIDISENISKKILKEINNQDPGYKDNLLEIYLEILSIIKALFVTTGFPLGYNEMPYNPEVSFWGGLPETGSFYKSLLTLATEFGIRWDDVHYNNIMIGADGNLKIVDVGLYSS